MENLMRKIIYILIAIQNIDKNTDHTKTKIDNTRQNSKCGFYHIISKCSKLAIKEYKSRHDWMGIVIHWELCKILKFDGIWTNKNLSKKIRFLISSESSRPKMITKSWLVLIYKKNSPSQQGKINCYLVGFAFLADQRRIIKESKNMNEYLHLAGELKNVY